MGKQAIEKQEGKVIDVTLTSDVNVGDIIPFDGMCGIAAVSGMTGEIISVELEKVWTVTAKNTDAINIGTKLYWDTTNEVATITATDNVYLGLSIGIKAADTAGTIDFKLNA